MFFYGVLGEKTIFHSVLYMLMKVNYGKDGCSQIGVEVGSSVNARELGYKLFEYQWCYLLCCQQITKLFKELITLDYYLFITERI